MGHTKEREATSGSTGDWELAHNGPGAKHSYRKRPTWPVIKKRGTMSKKVTPRRDYFGEFFPELARLARGSAQPQEAAYAVEDIEDAAIRAAFVALNPGVNELQVYDKVNQNGHVSGAYTSEELIEKYLK